MILATYMIDNELSAVKMAERLGYCSATIGRWWRGESIPSPDAMEKVAIVTAFQVMPHDFFPHLYDECKKRVQQVEDLPESPEDE